MPRRKPTRKPLIGPLIKKLRHVDQKEADIVIAIRMRFTDDGGWNVLWHVAHWLKFDPGQEPPPNCFPPGVAEELAKRFAYEAAKTTGGDLLGTLGASFGKAAVDKLGEALGNFTRKEG